MKRTREGFSLSRSHEGHGHFEVEAARPQTRERKLLNSSIVGSNFTRLSDSFV